MPDVPLLNPIVLNGVIEKFLLPETLLGLSDVFGPERVMPNPDPFVAYDVIEGNRTKAKPNIPNAEAHIIAQLGVARVAASMIYLRDKKVFSPTTVRWLRTPGQLAAKNAEAAILREIQDLDNRFNKFAEFAIWQIMTTGQLSVTGEGVVIFVDFLFKSSHKPTAGTVWTNPAADIQGDVIAWKILIARDAQAVATRVFLTSTTLGYLRKNTALINLFNMERREEVLQTGIVSGLLGLDWITYDLAYVDDNGVVTNYIPDNKIVMVSEDNPDRWYLYQGPSADFSAPDGHIGKFAKTWQEEDPSARQYLLEWHFLPGIWRPDQIIAATVA